jgi:hypothetical protein
MTYGSRRARVAGLIQWTEHINTYVLVPDAPSSRTPGTTTGFPLPVAADHTEAPPEPRQALRALNNHIENYIARTCLRKAAPNSPKLATKAL